MPERKCEADTDHDLADQPATCRAITPLTTAHIGNSEPQSTSGQLEGTAAQNRCTCASTDGVGVVPTSVLPASLSSPCPNIATAGDSEERWGVSGMGLLLAWKGRLAFGERLLDAMLEGESSVKVGWGFVEVWWASAS